MSGEQATLPFNLNPQDVIFSTRFVVPEGLDSAGGLRRLYPP